MIPGLGRSPAGGHGNPLQYSCLDNERGQVGYSPWGCKESDMTERLSTSHGHDKNGRHLGCPGSTETLGVWIRWPLELAPDLEVHSEPTLTLPKLV